MRALLTLLLCSTAMAGDLTSPFAIESTEVLPKNVSNPRLVQLYSVMDAKLNSNGLPEPLGAAFNRTITTDDLLRSQAEETKRNQLEAFLQSHGIEGAIGKTTGAVVSQALVTVPAFGWGVTDRLTLTAAVPIYQIDVKAKTGFVKNETGDAFVKAAAAEGDATATAEAINELNLAASGQATRLGYQPLESKSIVAPGDVQLIAKYQMISTDVHAIAIKPVVVLPTGREPNERDLLDAPTGDGRIKLGAALVNDLKLPGHVRWSQTLGYQVQLPHRMYRRIPKAIGNPLSDEAEQVERKVGNLFSFGTGLDRPIPRYGLTFGAAYHFQYQGQQQFGGSNPDNTRYLWLEALHPAQNLHSYTLSATFSTVEWHRAGSFTYPFEANVAYSAPITGQNVPNSPLMAAELVLFF